MTVSRSQEHVVREIRGTAERPFDGSGVAIGRNPHSARHLRDGLLVAPFGREAVLNRGTYFILIPPRSAERPVVKEFVAWLHDEVCEDAKADAEREDLGRRRSVRPAEPARTRGR